MSWVLDLWKPIREGTVRGPIDGRRRLLPQRFVRALVVEEVPEGVELFLLPGEICRGGPGCPALQGPVHPLVAGILLGMSRFDEFRVDAQPDPPDRQPGQAPQRGGGKGSAVVGADDPWQSVSRKRNSKTGKEL